MLPFKGLLMCILQHSYLEFKPPHPPWGLWSACHVGQSVLEGLNAMLDHREEVFVAELGQTFRAPPGFRVFAAQNPLQEGGGRKGLPKSFLNRFTRVHIDLLHPSDLMSIAGEFTHLCKHYTAWVLDKVQEKWLQP